MELGRDEGHDATDELRQFGVDNLKLILTQASAYSLPVDEVTEEGKKPNKEREPDPEFSAHFEGLVDLVEDAEGNVLFMLCDEDGGIEYVDLTTLPDGTSVEPPPKSQIPFALPTVAGIESIRRIQKGRPASIRDEILFEDIVETLKATAELPREDHYLLLAAWIMHTYLLDQFQYTPILCLFAVPERGKTRTGKILMYLSYRGLHVESLREAYILRISENLKCTLFIDVMDLWRKAEKSGSEDIILQRFEKGVKVARVNYPDRGPFQDTVFYNIFGPTVIGTNEALDNILDTRSITISMPESTRRFENDVTPEGALPLRERLLLFRASHMGKALPGAEKPSKGRLGDILRPLRQIIRLVRPEQEPAFMKLVEAIREERVADKSDSIEADVLRAVLECESDVDNGRLRIKQIVEALNRTRPERFHISPQRVGKRLSAMGFTKGKLGEDRAIAWNDDLMKKLTASYGLSA